MNIQSLPSNSQQLPQLILKKGKDLPIRNRHMWIFSGAIEAISPYATPDGSLVEVVNYDRTQSLGYAILNRKSSIAGRIVCFSSHRIEEHIFELIEKAYSLRKQLYPGITKEASLEMYRLIHAEGDGLSGLVIDIYGPRVAVIQISSLAMEKYRSTIISALQDILKVEVIYEKSTSASRRLEGLNPQEGIIIGDLPKTIRATEHGITYEIDIINGQKTGFFIDQSEMRLLVRSISKDKKVINCFSYSGGFSLNALKGGARSVLSLDISKDALKLINGSLELNPDLKSELHKAEAIDVFKWLERGDDNTELRTCDLLILDPPAFAKTKKDVQNALRGYREINRRAMQHVKPGALILTCSCSYHVMNEQFYEMLYKAACDSKRDIRILSHHRQSLDHGATIYHRETEYLKSALMTVF